MKWLKENKVLFLILLSAFILRIVGIKYGLPNFFVGDEQSQVGASLIMLRDFNPIPGINPEAFNILYYSPIMSYFYLIPIIPTLLVWLFFNGFDYSLLAKLIVLDPSLIWTSARFLIVLMGTASVWLLYKLTDQIFKDKVLSLFSAILLATSFFHVNLSHFTRHWIPTIFFSLLTYVAIVELYKQGNKRDYFWSAIFSTLSFGVGFVGIFNVPIPALVHFYKHGFNKVSFYSKKLFLNLSASVILLGVTIGLYPQRFFEIFGGTDISVSQSKSVADLLASFVFYVQTLFNADPFLLALSVFGLLYLVLKKNKFVLVFIGLIFSYIFMIYFVAHHEPRYISFIYPALIILSAIPMKMFWEKVIHQSPLRYLYVLLLVVMIVYPIIVSAKFSYLSSKPDTRDQAKVWIEENIPESAKILSFIHPEVLMPSKSAIDRLRNLDERALRTKDRVLLDSGEKFLKSFDLLSVNRIENIDNIDQVVKDFDADYAVLQYWTLEQWAEQKNFIGNGQPVVDFKGSGSMLPDDYVNNFYSPANLILNYDALGPVIEIYKLK